jgi:hypothetical protein
MKSTMSDGAPPSERRRAAREIACFPAYVEHEAPEKDAALIADIATGGALLLVRGPCLRAGEVVRLDLLIDVEAHGSHHVTGQVLRIEPLPTERVSLWTHQAAIEFDSPISLDADEQRTIHEQCERLGIRR